MKDSAKRIKRIKMLLLDVDGVMTDGGVILGPRGLELKRFGAQDGVGIALAKVAGLRVGIITGRNTDAVKRRAMITALLLQALLFFILLSMADLMQ